MSHDAHEILLVASGIPVPSGRRHQRPGAGPSARSRGLLAAEVADRRVRGAPLGRQSVRAEAAALQAAREGGDLAVHERRLSQVDTFDPSPRLTKYAGQPIDGKVQGDVIVPAGVSRAADAEPVRVQEARQSGIEVSEIFPNLSQHVDDIAFLRSVYGRSNDHVQAHLRDADGADHPSGFPSVGSWVTYGLGTENRACRRSS